MLSHFSKTFLSPCSSFLNSSINIQRKIKYFYIRPKKKQATPFKIQQQKIKQQAQKDNKKYGYLQFGMYGLVFALCFAGIPLYRVFCQHVGLVGNYDKKTYQFKKDKVKNFKKYIVKFEGQAQPGIDWTFQPIQKQIIIGTSQTAIVFYRLYNRQQKPIVGFSTYNITPQQANIYFSKIQCFCFNQQMVNPKQQLLLPIFFYLQPELADDPDVGRIREITVHYDFIRSNKQDLAKFAEEELKRVQENKKKLKEIRAKRNNMTIKEYQQYVEKEQIKQQEELEKVLEDDSNNNNNNNTNNNGNNNNNSLNNNNSTPITPNNPTITNISKFQPIQNKRITHTNQKSFNSQI